MKKYKVPLALFAVALIFRIFYYYLDNSVIGIDAADYAQLARLLAAGNITAGIGTYWAPLPTFLIALVSLFTDSYLLPTLIIAVSAGSLAPVAVFYLVGQSYGRRIAIMAAVIAVFYPHLLRSTFDFGSENIYFLVICAALTTFWKGLRSNFISTFFLSGIFLGLSYLTRPEAFGYLFFFILWIGFYKLLSGQKMISRNLLASTGALVLGFSFFAIPYIIHLRSETGNWTISGKFKKHVIGDESFTEKNLLYEKAAESPNPVIESSKLFAKLTLFNLSNIHKKLPYIFPPLLFIFVGIGLFKVPWTKTRLRRELYLSSFCFSTVLGYAVTVNEVRYFYILYPILFGWLAYGIYETDKWFRKSFDRWALSNFFTEYRFVVPLLSILLINIYLLPLHNFMRLHNAAWEFSSYEQMAAGRWLKANAKPVPKVMSVDFRPAFYAEGEYYLLPPTELQEILKQARAENIDFIIVDGRYIKERPQLLKLLNEPQDSAELQLVHQEIENPSYKLVIYKLLKPNN